MSALPRADLPPGAHRDLVTALHDLHHRAGWPSLRTLARETGVSHTTVSKAFSRPDLPSWGTLELLVEAMHGDTERFRDLWLSASTPTDGGHPPPRIAGRRAELDVVRRHLETGTGLLLVTGEAGIGKTTLDQQRGSAGERRGARHRTVPSAVHRCPLLPVADCLRSVWERDPAAFGDLVRGLPPFAERAIALLVPEAGGRAVGTGRPEDRGLLFSAVGLVLRALAAEHPLALVVEDLHWADPATRDLLEHLLGRTTPVPVIGTWRTDDASTSEAAEEWVSRVRRLHGTVAVELGPLTRAETAEQLALLGADDPVHVDAIQSRAQGHPLFAEQLASHISDGAGLPRVLADLLDRRLVGLSQPAWSAVRTLGVAERSLPPGVVATASRLDPDEVTRVLRDLTARRLVRSTASGEAQLQHPLLAEAVQRRLVAGERPAVHRALAQALAEGAEQEAGEVAEHWRRGGVPVRELTWRVAAAQAAAARFDRRQEADHWVRALEIWPDATAAPGDPATSRSRAYLAAMDALRASFRFDQASALSDSVEASLADLDDGERADLLFRRSIYRGDPDFENGLALVDEALAIHDRLPIREGKVRALDRKQNLMIAMGRSAEARAVADEEVDAARELGDPTLLRDALMRVAWHTAIGGDIEQGRRLLAEAVPESGAVDDPLGDVRHGVYETDLLLNSGAPADEVVAAGTPALEVAAAFELDNPQVMLVRVNVSFALLRAGRVREAERVAGLMQDTLDMDRWPLHTAQAAVQCRRGNTEAASACIERIFAAPSTSAPKDLEFLAWASDVTSWTGTPAPTFDHLRRTLVEVVGTAPVRLVAPAVLAAARAAAERPSAGSVDVVRDLVLRCGLSDAKHRVDAQLTAHAVATDAELSRAASADTVVEWAAAATAWDLARAPHDAAYCRWRAAQCALRVGQGTTAARLLRKAAADAREHVPLSRAIAATAAGVR